MHRDMIHRCKRLLGEHLVRRAASLQMTVHQQRHPVGVQTRQVQVVQRHEHSKLALIRQAAHQVQQAGLVLQVEMRLALQNQVRQVRHARGARLVAEQQAYVYNLALRLLGDSAEAEDLAQEALVRAWQMLPSFRGEARFTTWLYRIVVNLGLNRRARLRRTLATVSLDDVACPQVPGIEPDPLLAQTDQERKEWIWRQVDALPERYRVVIALYYQQERTYDEMAQILCLPLNTVKTHLARARHLLARRLAATQGGLDAL